MIDAKNKPLHFVIRFSDSLRQVDTIGEHKSIIQQTGACWWGKFGMGLSNNIVDLANSQIRAKLPTFGYLWHGSQARFRANITEIFGGGSSERYRAPEPELVPGYYRGTWCTAWFKFSEIQESDESEVRQLVYFNDRTKKIGSHNSRGIIYATTRLNMELK